MVMSLRIFDFKNYLSIRIESFLTFFVKILFDVKSYPVCDGLKFFPGKKTRCSSILIGFSEKMKKNPTELADRPIHVLNVSLNDDH